MRIPEEYIIKLHKDFEKLNIHNPKKQKEYLIALEIAPDLVEEVINNLIAYEKEKRNEHVLIR